MATVRMSPAVPPSAEQLAAERATRFHQGGDPLLTVEAARAWLNRTGLALYLPRPEQLPAPAPSFVEASIGSATAQPAPEQLEQARTILIRLISEGACVPLNLLGSTGASGTDTPDFLCSPAVFSFLFTLRGNKAWKTAPLTTGPVKVSPLALAAYELLAAKVTLSAYDLTTQLGKEVTEAAVLRALTELWQQLRVFPVPQADGSATLWELSTARFTKQIKAGANAGQPTALSALISLYLHQALAATEEEIETFLSPLAPRSRLRSVVHDLLATRQLETIAIDGKTLVHLAGEAPSSAGGEAGPAAFAGEEKREPAEGEPGTAEPEDSSRIRKFTPNPAAKLGTGLRARPAAGTNPGFGGARPAFGGKPGFGKKPGFAGGPGGERGADRERRPFAGARPDRDSRPPRPAFNKPWDEERAARSSNQNAEEAGQSDVSTVYASGDQPSPRPSFRPERASGAKPAFRDNSSFRDRPERRRREAGSGAFRPARPGARPDTRPDTRPGGFPPRPSGSGQGRPGFSARNEGAEREGSVPRRTFSKPGTFGRKREDGAGPGGNGRPPRREFGGPGSAAGSDRGPGSFGGPRQDNPRFRPGTSSDRAAAGGAGRPFPPRDRGDRPAYAGKPSFGGKPGFAGKPSFRGGPRFAAGPGASGPGVSGSDVGSEASSPRKTFRKFDAPREPRGPRQGRPASAGAGEGGAQRPFASTSGPRFAGKPRPASGSGGRPERANRPERSDRPGRPDRSNRPDRSSTFAGKGGPFAKFVDGKKPFRKPGAGKSGSGKSGQARPAGKPGGFAAVQRKRPDEEA